MISQAKNIEVGCHSLLQRIFLTQGLNPGLLHCRRILYCLSHQTMETHSLLLGMEMPLIHKDACGGTGWVHKVGHEMLIDV